MWAALAQFLTGWLTKMLGWPGWIINLIVEFIMSYVRPKVEKEIKQAESDNKIDEHAAKAVEEMKNAKTQDELDRADSDLLS